ncbi:hypothetical protein BDA99DRAFT_542734 [Phascolomyces articulosus]|uniref:Uncharacterized protein n=1 Tax=Phascolomyces articulosus TaxID=60185 RepID=A0AAD5P8Y4_9FUNG|nr:hypothetical protein BDA99DRAFT_542734 [Phascolomyces articulosus]
MDSHVVIGVLGKVSPIQIILFMSIPFFFHWGYCVAVLHFRRITKNLDQRTKDGEQPVYMGTDVRRVKCQAKLTDLMLCNSSQFLGAFTIEHAFLCIGVAMYIKVVRGND